DIRRLLQEAERRAQELREKQEQLIQAAKLASLGEMATGVAHEINNPLNNIALVVGNLLERLKRGCLDPDTLPRQLQSTMSQVEKAAIIVDHLRTFARPATMPHESISINEVVRSAVSLTQTQFRHADIDLTVDLTNSNPAVLGNAIHLEQVLINLLTNARDAVQGAPKKAVHIGSALEGSDVTVTVADTGSGIPKDLQARIFDPFFTTKDVGKGTGLGLSISYGIIQDHGGEITVESIPASGAKFTVRLPLAPDPSQPGHA
ncbi:MAG TPA: ATP-binding protein, partial [Nitrospiraceae bacterium]|nr:ATP-binding protein [Nitrospiraceae bacterium]